MIYMVSFFYHPQIKLKSLLDEKQKSDFMLHLTYVTQHHQMRQMSAITILNHVYRRAATSKFVKFFTVASDDLCNMFRKA